MQELRDGKRQGCSFPLELSALLLSQAKCSIARAFYLKTSTAFVFRWTHKIHELTRESLGV